MKDHPILDFTGVELPEGLKQGTVVAWSKFLGPQRALNKQYGVGQWGVKEVILYIQQRERLKDKAKHKDHRGKASYVLRSHENRVQKYLEHFESPTPNDVQSIRAMVDLEIQMFEVNAKRNQAKDTNELNKLAEIYTTLSREHRQLQVSLGIDRTNRETGLDAANEIKRFVDEAREFIEKETITIRCSHCRVRLDMGYILFHFRQDVPYEFRFKCPRSECGKITQIVGVRDFDGNGHLQDHPRGHTPEPGGDPRLDGAPSVESGESRRHEPESNPV